MWVRFWSPYTLVNQFLLSSREFLPLLMPTLQQTLSTDLTIDDRPTGVLPMCSFQGLFRASDDDNESQRTTTTTSYPIVNDLCAMNDRPMKKKSFNIRVTGIYRRSGYHIVSIFMTEPGRKVKKSIGHLLLEYLAIVRKQGCPCLSLSPRASTRLIGQ